MQPVKTIYVVCPDTNRPSGGVKQLYRHVDTLNKNGYRAFILHDQPGFRCSWFKNDTKVVYKSFKGVRTYKKKSIHFRWRSAIEFFFEVRKNPSLIFVRMKRLVLQFLQGMGIGVIRFSNSDCLVIPEVYGSQIAMFEKGIQKIIFNQNAHNTFSDYDTSQDSFTTPYLNEDVKTVIVVSDHNLNYLRYVFPELPLARIYYGIDRNIFNYSHMKKNRIAYMPRKLSGDINQVINILKFKKVLQNFEWVAIDGKDEFETAAILKESLIFLSFSSQEGFGLPPAEAMACGCVVIGYPGIAGEEYFNRDWCYPIPDGDVVAFAKTIQEVIDQSKNDRETLLQKGKLASEHILKTYSMEREESDIVRIWKKIEEQGPLETNTK